jgi:hypothetical protein
MAINIKPSHKGLFHKDVGKSEDEPITGADIKKGEHAKDPAERKRAVFAANSRKWHKGKRSENRAHRMYGKKEQPTESIT